MISSPFFDMSLENHQNFSITEEMIMDVNEVSCLLPDGTIAKLQDLLDSNYLSNMSDPASGFSSEMQCVDKNQITVDNSIMSSNSLSSLLNYNMKFYSYSNSDANGFRPIDIFNNVNDKKSSNITPAILSQLNFMNDTHLNHLPLLDKNTMLINPDITTNDNQASFVEQYLNQFGKCNSNNLDNSNSFKKNQIMEKKHAHITNLPSSNLIRSLKPTGNLIVCQICDLNFKTSKQLLVHKKKAHLECKPFSCSQCNESFNHQSNLILHNAIHQTEKFLCPECGKSFTRLASLKSHILIHQREESLMCRECGDEFNFHGELEEHVSKVHNVIHLRPLVATHTVTKGDPSAGRAETNIINNTNKNSNNNNFFVLANGSGSGYNNSALKPRPGPAQPSAANVIVTIPEPDSAHNDDGVPSVIFVPEPSPYQHRQQCRATVPDEGAPPQLTSACGTGPKTSVPVATTAKTPANRPIRPSPSYLTKQHPSFKRSLHRSSRSKYSHSCKMCDKYFPKPSQLERHMRIHTGEKPYKCHTCSRAFNQKGALLIHTIKHTGTRPYICDHCPSSFTQRGNLRIHVTRVHPQDSSQNGEEGTGARGIDTGAGSELGAEAAPLFRCFQCSCVFRKLGSLNTHISKVHAGLGSPTIDQESQSGEEYESEEDDSLLAHEVTQTCRQMLDAVEKDTISNRPRLPLWDVYRLEADGKPKEAAPLITCSERVERGPGLTGLSPCSPKQEHIYYAAVNPAPSSARSILLSGSSGDRPIPATTRAPTSNGSGSSNHQTSQIWQRVLKTRFSKGRSHSLWRACPTCGKAFKKPSDLVRHARIHTREKPYRCQLCARRFAVKSTLTAHARTHAAPVRERKCSGPTCSYCKKSFSAMGSLRVHLRLHTGLKPFECSHCGKKFRTSGHKKSHTLTAHRFVAPQGGQVPLLPHAAAPTKGGWSSGNGNTNNDVGLTPDAQDTPVLDTSPDLLSRPARADDPDRGPEGRDDGTRPYCCPSCPSRFKKTSHLKEHIRSHTGEKPYLCKLCNKSFVSNGILKTHMKIHDGDKRFKCTTCSLSFTTNASMQRHTVIHTQYRPYRCSACSKAFKTLFSCKKHIQTHISPLPVNRLPHDNVIISFGDKVAAPSWPSPTPENDKPEERSPSPLPTSVSDNGSGSQSQLHPVQHVGGFNYPAFMDATTMNPKSGYFHHITDPEDTPRSHQGLDLNKDGSIVLPDSACGSFIIYLCSLCGQSFAPQNLSDFEAHLAEKHVINFDDAPAPTLPSQQQNSGSFGESIGPTLLMNPENFGGSLLPQEDILMNASFSSQFGDMSDKDDVLTNYGHIYEGVDILTDDGTTLHTDFDTRAVPSTTQCEDGSDLLGAPGTDFATIYDMRRPESRGLHSTAQLAWNDLNNGHDTDELITANKYHGPTANESAIHLSPYQGLTIFEAKRSSDVPRKNRTNKKGPGNDGGNVKHNHCCRYCPKSFKKPSDLVRHLRIHTGEKPYACDRCDKRFAVKSTLDAHAKTHTGEKHYECPICQTFFSTRGSLKVHTRLHTGSRPFKCPYCPQLFRTSGHRKSHVISHGRNGPSGGAQSSSHTNPSVNHTRRLDPLAPAGSVAARRRGRRAGPTLHPGPTTPAGLAAILKEYAARLGAGLGPLPTPMDPTGCDGNGSENVVGSSVVSSPMLTPTNDLFIQRGAGTPSKFTPGLLEYSACYDDVGTLVLPPPFLNTLGSMINYEGCGGPGPGSNHVGSSSYGLPSEASPLYLPLLTVQNLMGLGQDKRGPLSPVPLDLNLVCQPGSDVKFEGHGPL